MSEMDEFILQTLAEHDFCLRELFSFGHREAD